MPETVTYISAVTEWGDVGKTYREETVQCLRLGLVHMLLASSLSLALMQAILCAIICGVVEKTKDD